MSEVIANTVDSVKAFPTKIDPSTVTEPVTKAGRHVYDRASEGVQWYLEQLEDLLHEAEAERTKKFAKEGLTVNDLLGSLNEAKVSSSIPGRARLNLPSLKRQKDVSKQLEEALVAFPGVSQAQVNHLTGSVLVLFDKSKYHSLDSLLQALKSEPTEAESPSTKDAVRTPAKSTRRKRKPSTKKS